MEKEYDIRNDEEQEKKCNEVLELLVTAGYFRARIKGLSNFDKVVGGIVWCIEVCSVDIDIDLLFQEDLSIGKKISLTEKIVAVVNQMECPFKIEPHQIQGLDYIHIFPVVKWLVKKAIETRQLEGDKVRAFAVNQYHKEHQHTEQPGQENQANLNGIENIEEKCKPKRIYRRKNDQELERPETDAVDLTLLEYGQRHTRPSETNQSIQDEQINEIVKPNDLENDQVSAKVVKGILNVDMLTEASEKYLQLKEDTDSLKNSPNAIEKAINIMEEQKEAIIVQLNAVQGESKALEPELVIAIERTDKLAADMNQIEHEILELELPDDKEELLAKLQKLVSKNELLKEKESEFKDQCRKEMEDILNENEKLEQELKILKGEQATPEVKDDPAEIAILEKLRKKLTNVTRQVLSIEKQLDAIPSRYELSQYQKRFVELDNQVSAEYCETQKFIIMYNTLRDQLLFMEKEVKLLNSIYDGIPDAKMSSVGFKEQFKHQLEQIHLSVHSSQSKIEQSFREQQQIHDSANQDLNQLMELQRTYSVLVRDMTEEMRKNEILSSD